MHSDEHITHDQLVEVGRKWLSKPWRNCGQGGHSACSVILTEMVHAESETPDVIGWHNGFTTLIECKVSRADFRADAKKHFRRYSQDGLGYYRYFMTPKGLLDLKTIPHNWGVIEVSSKGKTRVIWAAQPFYESNRRTEVSMLLSLIRRLKVDPGPHVKIRAYTIEDGCKPRATVTLNQTKEEEKHGD